MTAKLYPIQKATPVIDSSGAPTQYFLSWLNLVTTALSKGYSGTITTAKLTGGGANGSMTFVNGVLTSETAAT